MFSRVSLKNLRKHGLKITSNRFETCPKCGYNDTDSKLPTSLPGGINPALLLDSSPSPQLLLSESNVIVYANKCAARIFKVNVVEELKEEESVDAEDAQSTGDQENEEAEDKPITTGLEGHTLDQLNIDIADEEIRRFLTLIQVLENIKLNLNKRESRKRGTDANVRAELYGEGPKYTNYDYYGDLERASKGHGIHADRAIRDTAPVVIEREDGKKVPATMFVSLIDPFSTGYSYSSISFVPGDIHDDATFTTQMTVEDKQMRRKRKRDMLRSKLTHENRNDPTAVAQGAIPENGIGRSGESMIERVRRIKDLILDEMEYCFIALSPDGDIVITNAATKAVLGQETLQASIGEGFEWIARLDIWRPDFSERLPFEEWALNRLITHHQPLTQVIGMYAGPYQLVVELRGKCIWQDPVKEEGLLAALAIVVDQTKWFNKEKQMLDIQARQEMFISTISRELKTPVAGMVGLLELLYATRKDLNPQQLNYIRQIFGSVNSLLLVINDVIDFNKIIAGDVAIVRRTFILQDLVEELETLFTESMAKEGVEFVVDASGIDRSAFGDGSRLMLLGDDGKIRRIVINMLSNGFKFTVKGKVILRVRTQKVMRNSLEVRFEVEDTGVGISEEDRRRLFAPLDELSAKDARAVGLDGIGLNIARKFASLLAGNIGCESTVGKGTTFWFTAPCGRPLPDSEVTFGPKEMTLSKTMGIVIHNKELEGTENSIEDEKAKVRIEGTVALLVEDNWAHQVVIEKRLRKIGCEVLTAVTGRDALAVLQRPDTRVDIVFMDIQMPLLDGFEATKIIRRDPEYEKWKHLPIIGVTATDGPGDRDKAKSCGLNEFLVKPLTNDGTKEIIQKFMDPVSLGKRRATTFRLED
ncbi:hypothetical protein BZA77DRAFT_367265 [Pyronema omphalodes]|nr:hypothetical protein BZA77DRAFT_367265 [Pyronema omphalodes]